MSYKADRERADSLMPLVRSILSGLPLSHFAEVNDAPIERDLKHATDLTLRITGGDIAARLRFPPCSYRELTIRAHRDSGMETELSKIIKGFAYRYFYGWIGAVNGKLTIPEWILVDLDKIREMGLLTLERKPISNYDGTSFISIPVKELRDAGCMIDSQLKGARQVNPQASLIEGIERAKHSKYYNPRIDYC